MKAWKFKTLDSQGVVFSQSKKTAMRIAYESTWYEWSDISLTRASDLDEAWGDKRIQANTPYSGTHVRKALKRQKQQLEVAHEELPITL